MVGTSGICFLNRRSIEDLLELLHRQFDLTPTGPWTLDHRSYVGTALNNAGSGETRSRKWLQAVMLSHRSKEQTSLIITQAESVGRRDGMGQTEPPIAISVPSSDAHSFGADIGEKFTLLWTPRDHHSVRAGQAFEARELRIRVGELTRQQYRGVRAGAGSEDSGWVTVNEQQRTIVLSVEVVRAEDAQDKVSLGTLSEVAEVEAQMIRNLYGKLGLGAGNDSTFVMLDVKDGKFEEAKTWCEGLRIHGRGILHARKE